MMKLVLMAMAGLMAVPAMAQTPAAGPNRIDLIRPDAPELSPYGAHPVGVRTMTFTDPDRADIVNAPAEGEVPRADRAITVEVWYPAADGTGSVGTYEALLRDGVTTVALTGRAVRDAAPASGKFPLVVISHGYPGNRFLLSHLGENLASKGYVTVAPDHPDSTYDDMTRFASTLVNRPVDQAFVVDQMARLEGEIGAIVDAERTGVVGYSMGGYGALIFGGAGVSQAAVDRTEPERYSVPQGLLGRHLAGSETHRDLVDPRVKAVVAIGPWGRNRDFWDADGLAGFEKPLLIVAGGADAVSMYDAIRMIFEETTGTERHLLTYANASHNAGAPMPAPAEAWLPAPNLPFVPFEHYADPVWDTVRMNNILAHIVTAFLDLHLKGEAEKARYLEPAAPGETLAGFKDGTASGLTLETLAAQ